MWHASVSHHGRFIIPDSVRLERAYRVLRGVGDARSGEWVESTSRALHVRRRLTEDEQKQVTVADIRRTPEAVARWWALPRQIREFVPAGIIDDEIGELPTPDSQGTSGRDRRS